MPPPARPSGSPGLTLPGLANAHSHAFHRALRGAPQAGAGLVLDLARADVRGRRRLDPETLLRASRGRPTPRWRSPGSPPSASSTTCTTAPADSRTPIPNEMGRALIAAAAARPGSGSRCSTPATCTAASASRPTRCQRRFADGSADAWARARRRARRPTLTAPDRRRDPQRPRGRPGELRGRGGVGRRAGDRPLHAHVSEQPAENEACLAAYGRHADRRARATPGRSGRASPRCTPPTSTDADIGLLGGSGGCCCLCPTTERDLADGIGPARSLVDAGSSLSLGTDSHAVIDMFEEARAVELDERLATRRARPPRRAEPAARGHRRRPRLDRLARGRGRSQPGAPRTSSRSTSTRCASPGSPPRRRSRASSSPPPPPTCGEVVCGGTRIVPDGRHATIDVAAELGDSIAEAHG